MQNNQHFFDVTKQVALIRANKHLVAITRSATNVYEWNLLRDTVADRISDSVDRLMLLGFLDGYIFPQVKKSWS